MQLRKLLTDDDAVSPVIGVILMVAITVILAAVIASFVLGLGGEQEVAPQHTFTFDYDSDPGSSGEGVLTITSQGGDPVRDDELFIRGDGFCSCGSPDMDDSGEWDGSTSGEAEGTSAITAGDSVTVGVSNDYSISVIWESIDSSTSSELASDDGPAS